jgi:glycogen(starch) synthase
MMLRGKPIRVMNNALALALDGHRLDIATYAVGKEISDYLSNEFREAGERIEVHRARSGIPLDPDRPGFSVGKIANNVALYYLVRRLIRQQRFDVVICHDADGMLLGLILKRRIGIPVVYDMHGSLSELMSNIHNSSRPVLAVAGWVERRLYAGADLILANWPHLIEVIGGEHAEKSCVVRDRPPVTTTSDSTRPPEQTDWKSENDVDRLIVYVGNSAAYQRVDLLIDMMAHLIDAPDRITLCLIGPGLKELRGQAARYPEADIRFLGPLYGDELARVLQSADLALSPRVTVNYPPMKVISYLNAAIPVIATDCSAHRAMIDHEVTGLLEPPTPDAFAAAVCRLIADEEMRSKLRAKALQQRESYSFNSLMSELRAALARLTINAQCPGQ